MPGQQAVQHRTQAVDVGGGARRAVGELFGRGVTRCQRTPLGRGGLVVRTDQPRDAEIQQLHLALGIDQHVGRLQIAVNHQVTVRRRDRHRHLAEQLHDLARIQGPLFAPAVDVFTPDQRHRQPWGAVIGHAGVDQADDVRMRQPRQDVGFAPELGAAVAAQAGHGQQFQRHHLVRRAIDTVRAVHHRHAAARQFGFDFPAAQAPPGHRLAIRRRVVALLALQQRAIAFQPVRLLFQRLQHAIQTGADRRRQWHGRQPCRARGRVQFDQSGKDAISLDPDLALGRIHGISPDSTRGSCGMADNSCLRVQLRQQQRTRALPVAADAA